MWVTVCFKKIWDWLNNYENLPNESFVYLLYTLLLRKSCNFMIFMFLLTSKKKALTHIATYFTFKSSLKKHVNNYFQHAFVICFAILKQVTFSAILRVQYLSETSYSSQFVNATEFQRLLALLLPFISFGLVFIAFNTPSSCIKAHLHSLSTSDLLNFFHQIIPSNLTQ